VYYPETGSVIPPEAIQEYRPRDYAAAFNTTPRWTKAVEDDDDFVEWAGGGDAMEWTAEEAPDGAE